MKNRMNDSQFDLKIPLCKTCTNCVLHKFDARDPLKPIMECRVLGVIPEDIELAQRKECNEYQYSESAQK